MLTQGDHRLKLTWIIHKIFSLILGYLTNEDNEIHMFSIPSNEGVRWWCKILGSVWPHQTSLWGIKFNNQNDQFQRSQIVTRNVRKWNRWRKSWTECKPTEHLTFEERVTLTAHPSYFTASQLTLQAEACKWVPSWECDWDMISQYFQVHHWGS